MSFYDRPRPPKPLGQLELPLLENYHSDYLQLGFYYREFIGSGEGAYYEGEEDVFGYHSVHIININLYALKLWYKISFEDMVKRFVSFWNHEYIHMIGIDEQQMRVLHDMGVDV